MTNYIAHRASQKGDKIMKDDKNILNVLNGLFGASIYYVVGESCREAIGCPDEVYFDLDDGGINVEIYLSNVSERELAQVNSASFEMKLVQLRGIIFGLFKFGSLNWMDAPYNVHLSRNLTELEIPGEGCGFSMNVRLYDTATGMLVCNRLLSLSTEMSLKLIDMIEEQRKKPFDKREYDNAKKSVYAAYSTKKLVKMASCSYKLLV